MHAEGADMLVRSTTQVQDARSSRIVRRRRVHEHHDQLTLVRSELELRELVAYLRFEDRRDPVIAMTSGEDSDDPLLPYAPLRGVVGDRARIYMICNDLLLHGLAGAIGAPLALSKPGVRAWWPGVSVGGDPGDHPFTIALDGESEESLLEEFAHSFDLTRPRVRREIKLIEDIRALAERRLEETNRWTQLTEGAGNNASTGGPARFGRRGAAEWNSRVAGALDTEERLHLLIGRAWVSAVTSADRRVYPLRYVLSKGFVESVERQPSLQLERLAWVCAMAACRYPHALRTLASHRLLSRASESATRERRDSAMGWRCLLPATEDGTSHLCFWVLANQTVEIVEVQSSEDSV